MKERIEAILRRYEEESATNTPTDEEVKTLIEDLSCVSEYHRGLAEGREYLIKRMQEREKKLKEALERIERHCDCKEFTSEAHLWEIAQFSASVAREALKEVA